MSFYGGISKLIYKLPKYISPGTFNYTNKHYLDDTYIIDSIGFNIKIALSSLIYTTIVSSTLMYTLFLINLKF